MSKLDIAKEVISEYLPEGLCGIFDCLSREPDEKVPIYVSEGLVILFCWYWSYFEVFGLSDEEFKELENWYDMAVKEYFRKEKENG